MHSHAGEPRPNELRGPRSGSANGLRQADAIVLVRRRRLAIQAGFTTGRTGMDVTAPGIIHAGSGSLLRTGGEGRAQGPDPFAVASADKRRRSASSENANGCTGTACPPDSAAHPSRTRPCRDAGNRPMRVPGAGNRATERHSGGRKGRTASELRGISSGCVAFRAARSRSAASRITPDNFRYQERTCQSGFA